MCIRDRININANDKLGEGTYGEVYTYKTITEGEMAIKIMKQPQDSIGGYYGNFGYYEDEQLVHDETLLVDISEDTDGEIEINEMNLVSGFDRDIEIEDGMADTIHLGQKRLEHYYGTDFFRDAYIIDEFIYNNNKKRFEVNLDDQPKTQLFSNLSEAVLLHKLSQMEVGKHSTLRTVAPKIYGVYLYMNDINQFYVAYTMERGNSLDNILEDMFANYQTVNHNIVYDMQIQIYELMTAQYDAGYINLDLNPSNLIVNKKGNLQIIDSGSFDFTLEVDKLKEPSILEGNDTDIYNLKKILVIFAQQLLIFGYIARLFKTKNVPRSFKTLDMDLKPLSITMTTLFKDMIPTAIGELKKLNYSKDKVITYLTSIHKYTQFSYRKILTKYSVSASVFNNIKFGYLDTRGKYDDKFTAFLIEIVNDAYKLYDRFFNE